MNLTKFLRSKRTLCTTEKKMGVYNFKLDPRERGFEVLTETELEYRLIPR
jgi:hypothetical protein